MKRTYGRGRGATDFKDSGQVYLRNDVKADSLDPRYNGPFPVVSAILHNVTIDVGGGKTKTVPLDRCKVVLFQSPTIPQSQTRDGENAEDPPLTADRPPDSVHNLTLLTML